MVHPKRKRQLSFEQLDNRIAMNSDMHPSASIAFDPLPTRNFAGHFEIHVVAMVRSLPAYALAPHAAAQRPLNPPTTHRVEPVRLKVNMGMKAPAEGEFIQTVSIVLPSQALLSSVANVASSSPALARSSPNLTELSVDVPKLNSSMEVPRPEPRAQIPSAVVSSPREFSASTAARSSSPAPLMDASPAKGGAEAVANTSQKVVLQSQSRLDRESISSTATQAFPIKGVETAKRSEITKATENGMLTFSMREAADRSNAKGSSGGMAQSNGYRTHMDLQWLQMADRERLLTELTGSSKRLPMPKGMLEIGDFDADNATSRSQSIVSRASNNPFEILQLFIGSTNTMKGAEEVAVASPVPNASRMIGTDFQSDDSTELATKEDSILALAVGVVFAMAFRQWKMERETGNVSALLPSSIRTRIRWKTYSLPPG